MIFNWNSCSKRYSRIDLLIIALFIYKIQIIMYVFIYISGHILEDSALFTLFFREVNLILQRQ